MVAADRGAVPLMLTGIEEKALRIRAGGAEGEGERGGARPKVAGEETLSGPSAGGGGGGGGGDRCAEERAPTCGDELALTVASREEK